MVEGQGSNGSWWSLEGYSRYFNVNTREVADRLTGACRLDEHLLEELGGRWDLYGPLWLSVTLPVAMFVSSSLATVLGGGAVHDFGRLSVGLIETLLFTIMASAACWGILRWRGVESVKAAEIIAVVGYSLTPMLPALVITGTLMVR